MKEKTLTYWVAECLRDASAYNLRSLTLRELKEQLAALGSAASDFGPPHKVVVRYYSPLDLLFQCLSEGSIYEGEE